jgi:hypothetical protein
VSGIRSRSLKDKIGIDNNIKLFDNLSSVSDIPSGFFQSVIDDFFTGQVFVFQKEEKLKFKSNNFKAGVSF